MLVPKIVIQETETGYHVQLPKIKDYQLEKAEQKEKQALILEKLRAKKYVRDKSIFFMQKIADFVDRLFR